MTFTHVHFGGYFWTIDRVEREAAILRLATDVPQMVVIAVSDSSASEMAHRLTLSGLPVLLGTTRSGVDVADGFRTDGVSTLVASDAFVQEHGPFSSPLTVHTRLAASAREYQKRLDTSVSPVHLTFVVPEDVRPAEMLIDHIGDVEPVDDDSSDPVETVLDLTHGSEAATTRGRRRFPLGR